MNGEPKKAVSRELKIKIGTLDVALHRARQSLRRRLELLCVGSSGGKRLEYFFPERKAAEFGRV